MKKVYKYATGEEIPDSAIYLKTVVQKEIIVTRAGRDGSGHMDSRYDYKDSEKCWLVWHYFLVEVGESK